MWVPELEADQLPVCFRHIPCPLPELKACVIVPACNEAEHLRQTLDALRLQTDTQGRPIDHRLYEVLLLINNTIDNSAEIAAAYQQQYPLFNLYVEDVQLPGAMANVGTARRLLMDKACERLTQNGHELGIIASTDGDTLADRHWLWHIMHEIDRGNDAVGGRILTYGPAGCARRHHLRDVTYRCLLARAEMLIDKQVYEHRPRHFQYFGASMAVTCRMYITAGRLPRVPCLEDVAFHKALLQHDARISQSFEVKVYTSMRLQGRVSIGFSEQLRKWTHEQQANIGQTVEPLSYTLFLFNARNCLRRCWQQYKDTGRFLQEELLTAASLVYINAARLAEQLRMADYFGKVWDKIEQTLHQRYALHRHQPQAIEEAIMQLRMLLNGGSFPAFPVNQAGNWAGADEAAA